MINPIMNSMLNDSSINIMIYIIVAVVGIGIVGIVVAELFLIFRDIYFMATWSKWPTCKAIVTKSEVIDISSWEYGRQYYPQIFYNYAVEGKKYIARHKSFFSVSGSGMTKIEAEKAILNYPVGASITICYYSLKPVISVIKAFKEKPQK